MALTCRQSESERDTAERARSLLLQRDDLHHQNLRLQEIRRRVAAYERRYGVQSDRLHAAIDDGTLTETHEVCRWIMDSDLLRRSGAE